MKLLAGWVTFYLISIGVMLLAIDFLLMLAAIFGGTNELEATTGWWDLFVGLGVPAVVMLAGGLFLARRLPPQ